MRKPAILFLGPFVLVFFVAAQSPTECELRCTAGCLSNQKGKNLEQCEIECVPYGVSSLCADEACWTKCKDLGTGQHLDTPNNFRSALTEGARANISWDLISNADLYVIRFKRKNDVDYDDQNILTTTNTYLNMDAPFGPCEPFEVEVAGVSALSVGEYSKHKTISPVPLQDATMSLISMKYINEPFVDDFYKTNGTIEVVFKYKTYEWPLGADDLEIEPLFQQIACAVPDLAQAIPTPILKQNSAQQTLTTRMGSDMMDRRCRYVYYLWSLKSKKCGTYNHIDSPPAGAMQELQINCTTVENSNCDYSPSPLRPLCGQVSDVTYNIITPNVNEETANLTLNVTFEREDRSKDVLYYKALWGPAIDYATADETSFLGVNITNVTGETTNCRLFNGHGLCQDDIMEDSMVVSGILMDTEYGITLCAIRDINYAEPDLSMVDKSYKPKATKIYIDSKEFTTSYTGLIIGLVLAGIALLVAALFIFCFIKNRRTTQKNKLYELKLQQMERDSTARYTEFPKKQDIWEIERRNLIIHNDQKLGSGAFGAVYLGKLLGKSKGHADANSPLGVNIMRSENCQVAVKMLPEFVDDLSRSEFLREIALMKTLGYHERLVNMLACITESEPLCLVVEYCSDGDLLHYLRERCKYMMKLDEMGTNYQEPCEEKDYDEDMIVTLKQLLMFAVQISYGLEYLSQKGFVHRDVAARNVLVNDKNSCKIGDFGLCRYIYAESAHYKSKGGRLPLKWMSPEAIRHYEFSNKSDVWSFGILLFEIITLGGSPYPNIQPEDMLPHLEQGGRMEKPDNCPHEFYSVMTSCWEVEPEKRPEFVSIRQRLASQLEELTEEYCYLKLDAQRDYYNVQYGDHKPDVIVIPETDTSSILKERTSKFDSLRSSISIDSLPVDDVTSWTPEKNSDAENIDDNLINYKQEQTSAV